MSEAHRKHLFPYSPITLFTSKKAAFTLAEVLITLGIIGVVAAMTIPTLITSYKEKQTVSQLTKAYSTLSSAFQMMQAEYGTIDTWGLTNSVTGMVDDNGNRLYNHDSVKLVTARFKKYLKVAKTCELDKVCFPGKWYNLAGDDLSDAETTTSVATSENLANREIPPESSFYLNDGTFVSFGCWNSDIGDIYVILPGSKDAILGKTRFYFNMNSKGLIPFGMQNTSHYATFEDYCNPDASLARLGFYGQGCTAWVIYNKNLDYLHCRDKLSWDGAHSCKE